MSGWSGTRVAVTGATGFLGSHLTGALVRAGADVAVLVRDEPVPSPVTASWWDAVHRVRGDLVDAPVVERLLAEYEVEVVFHLAAQSQVGVANRNPVSTFEANIAGTWVLLEACRRSPGVERVLVTSSDKAYGAQPVLPYTEDMSLDAVNPYDVSKACADLLTRCYHQAFDLAVCTTRCGNLYGPGDLNWQRLVPGTMRSVLAGDVPLIRSDGSMIRDYVYVLDAVDALLGLTDQMGTRPDGVVGEAFNISTGEPLSVLELVAAIQRAAGSDLESKVLGVATNEIDQQHLDASKLHATTGWTAAHSLQDALSETLSWYADLLGTRA
ncbi:MAG: NAD-dependent epimerase/dehydratase family protein [Acidimicrobiales bacterium]